VTDVRSELAKLEVPGGGAYYRSRIPCGQDSEIATAVSAFADATPREQAAFRAGVDRTRSGSTAPGRSCSASSACRWRSTTRTARRC
jgi:hypothetical protein